MRIVEDNHPLEGAGLCFICETAIARDHQSVLDTGYTFDPPFQTQLTGQKYICQPCAETIAYSIGYVSTADVANAKHAINTIKAQIQEVADSVSGLASALVQEAGSLRDLPVFDLPEQVDLKLPGRPEGSPEPADDKVVPEAVTEKETEESVGKEESVPSG